MKKIFLFLFGIYLTSSYAGGFENLGVHSRVIGLGGAFFGLGDASYTVFYNPAGLSHLNRIEVNSTYSKLFPGVEDDNLHYLTFSGAVPLDIIGNFGLGVTYLKTGFWNENTFIFSYGRQIWNSFCVGGSVKLLRWSAEAPPGESPMSFLGFSFDAGAFFTVNDVFDQGNIRLGVAVQDITQPSIAKNGSADAKLPFKLGFGISYISSKYDYIIVVDGVKEEDIFTLKIGAEFLGLKTQILGIESGFIARAGYNNIINDVTAKESSINVGFGIFMNNFRFDYAYYHNTEIQTIGGSHKFSIGYQF